MTTKGSLSVLQVVSTGARVGVSGVVSLLVRGLKARHLEPTVVALSAGPLAEEVRRYGIPAGVVPVDRAFDPGAILRLRRWLGGRRFDVVHTHGQRAMFVGNLAARSVGAPVVSSFHEVSPVKATTSRHHRLYVRAEHLLARWFSDATVATSRAVFEDCLRVRKVPERTLRLIPNAVDSDKFHRLGADPVLDGFRARLGLQPGDVVIGTLGSLAPIKGQAHLIEALPRIRSRVPHARVVIAGFGPLLSELEALASKLGVKEHVVFAGDVAEPNLLYNCLDVFTLPSLSESTPLVVLESIACRVPVVATAVGDVPLLLDGGRAGVLVPPGNPEKLAEGIVRVLTEPGVREGNVIAAAAHVARTYSAEAFIDRHVELYRSVQQNRA